MFNSLRPEMASHAPAPTSSDTAQQRPLLCSDSAHSCLQGQGLLPTQLPRPLHVRSVASSGLPTLASPWTARRATVLGRPRASKRLQLTRHDAPSTSPGINLDARVVLFPPGTIIRPRPPQTTPPRSAAIVASTSSNGPLREGPGAKTAPM